MTRVLFQHAQPLSRSNSSKISGGAQRSSSAVKPESPHDLCIFSRRTVKICPWRPEQEENQKDCIASVGPTNAFSSFVANSSLSGCRTRFLPSGLDLQISPMWLFFVVKILNSKTLSFPEMGCTVCLSNRRN